MTCFYAACWTSCFQNEFARRIFVATSKIAVIATSPVLAFVISSGTRGHAVPHDLQYRPVVMPEPYDRVLFVARHGRDVRRHANAARLAVERVKRAVVGVIRAVLIARVRIRAAPMTARTSAIADAYRPSTRA